MTTPPELRTRQERIRRRAGILFLVYVVALAFIAFWPSPVDANSAGSALRSGLRWLHEHGVPEWLNYNLVEAGANVVLFLPFGFLGALSLGPHLTWLAAVGGVGASVAIELGQHLLLTDRYATLQDVLANSLGAALGTQISSTLQKQP